jgi:hypothetical protein
MFYVAEDPELPGTAFASCLDLPEYKLANLDSIRDWETRGATVLHVDKETMVTMMEAWRPKARQLALKVP